MQQCEMLEYISALIDGELPAEEVQRVRQHLAECLECRSAHEDFLGTRQILRAHHPVRDAQLQQRARQKLFAKERERPWSQAISIPLPVAAVLALLFLIMAAALVRDQHSNFRAAHSAIIEKALPTSGDGEEEKMSLAAFDHGGRAVVYKSPQGEGAEQKR